MSDLSQVSLEGRISSYTMFLLLDCVETLQMFSEKEFAKQGFKLKPNQLYLLSSIKYAVRDLRKSTLLTGVSSQFSFGEDAEFLFKVLMLVVDRFGMDEERDKILDILKEFPSVMGLDLRKFGFKV